MIKFLHVIGRCHCSGNVNYCTNKLLTNSLFWPLVQSKQSRLVFISKYSPYKTAMRKYM